jgi:hypothetical protein
MDKTGKITRSLKTGNVNLKRISHNVKKFFNQIGPGSGKIASIRILEHCIYTHGLLHLATVSPKLTHLVSVAARQVGGKALHLLPALGEHFGIAVRCYNEVPATLDTVQQMKGQESIY